MNQSKRIDMHDLNMVAFESDPTKRARGAVIAVDSIMQRNYADLKARLVPHIEPVIVVNNDDRGGQYTLINNEMVFPTDRVLADSLKGPEDLLSNAIGRLIQCPYAKHKAAASR